MIKSAWTAQGNGFAPFPFAPNTPIMATTGHR